MKRVVFFNKHSIFLFCAALVINIIFLCVNYKTHYYEHYRVMHGELAYNMAVHNSIQSHISDDPLEMWGFLKKENPSGYISNLKYIEKLNLGIPQKRPIYHVHIGYSIIIGLLWKITRSFSFLDILILQVLIFSFLMFLWYQIGYFLFGCSYMALWCGIALLLFFPIFFMNVHVLRDIWQFYGIVLLLYGVLAYLNKRIEIGWLLFLFSLFSFCLFIRSPMFLVVLAMTAVLCGYAFFNRTYTKRVLTILVCLWGTNLLFFWIPFVSYNKKVYGEAIVGPVGDGLLQGIGEYSNPWGYPSGEAAQSDLIKKKYGIGVNDYEYDKVAKKLALDAIKDNPLFFIKVTFKRIFHLILPSIMWYSWNMTTCKLFKDSYESICDHIKDVVYQMTHDVRAFIDIVFRAFYTRLFIILGYVGMILLFIRRKYFVVSLLFLGIIITTYSIALSHIEDRYFISAYAFYSFFVGYVLSEIGIFIKRKIMLKKTFKI